VVAVVAVVVAEGVVAVDVAVALAVMPLVPLLAVISSELSVWLVAVSPSSSRKFAFAHSFV